MWKVFGHATWSWIFCFGVFTIASAEGRIDFNQLDAKQIRQLGLPLGSSAQYGARSGALARPGRSSVGRNFTQVEGTKLHQRFPEKSVVDHSQ